MPRITYKSKDLMTVDAVFINGLYLSKLSPILSIKLVSFPLNESIIAFVPIAFNAFTGDDEDNIFTSSASNLIGFVFTML